MDRFKAFYKKFTKFIFWLSTVFEVLISLVILVCIGIEIVSLLETYEVFSMDLSTVQLRMMLSDILWLVIGLEFIKMLLEHSQSAVLDVMLFALARQMVLEHAMLDNLIAVVAVAGIFAVRKFLYDKSTDREPIFANLLDHQRKTAETQGNRTTEES